MAQDWSGNFLALDTGAYVNSPASPVMSVMIASDPAQYYREEGTVSGTETDSVSYNASNYFLVRVTRANFELMKLVSQFSFSAMTVGGNYTLRLIHKSLGTYYTLEQALKSCGVMLSGFVEDFSPPASGGTSDAERNGTPGWIAMNTALGPHGIQIWRV